MSKGKKIYTLSEYITNTDFNSKEPLVDMLGQGIAQGDIVVRVDPMLKRIVFAKVLGFYEDGRVCVRSENSSKTGPAKACNLLSLTTIAERDEVDLLEVVRNKLAGRIEGL